MFSESARSKMLYNLSVILLLIHIVLKGLYTIGKISIRPKQRFLVSACVASDQCVVIFFFLAMKRCPIAAQIAGLIGILPHCVLNYFSQRSSINVWPICVASLSHHTLCMGNLVCFNKCISVSRISLVDKKTKNNL